MDYPIYKTKNGTPITAYVAECVGKYFDFDGGEKNFKGKDGVIGSYTTAEAAIEAAIAEKTETCSVKVTDTRADNGSMVIFEQ